MNLILLNNFNNYFNRQVKVYSTISEYTYLANDYFILQKTNFNPNDGISTVHIVGNGNHPYDKEWQPDYVLETNEIGTIILSRWYVIEFKRLMVGQYQMTLKRDSIADKIDIIKNSPCYIEKGYVSNNNPLVVNNEGLSLNQIKTKEWYLKDETKVPWVVAYISKKRNYDQSMLGEVKAKYFGEVDGVYDNPDDPNYEELQLIYNTLIGRGEVIRNHLGSEGYKFIFHANNLIGLYWVRSKDAYFRTYNQSSISGDTVGFSPIGASQIYSPMLFSDTLRSYWEFDDTHLKLMLDNVNLHLSNRNNFYNYAQDIMSDKNLYRDDDEYRILPESLINKWNGKIISNLANNQFFKIEFSLKYTDEIYQDTERKILLKTEELFRNSLATDWEVRASHITDVFREIHYTNVKRSYKLSAIAGKNIKMTIPASASTDYETINSMYDIIAFPARNFNMQNGNEIIICKGNASINIASNIRRDLGDFCYDVQIMPYCPLRDILIDNNTIDYQRANQVGRCFNVYIDDGNNTIATVGIMAKEPSFSFRIDKVGNNIETDQEQEIIDITELKAIDRKIQTNTDMFRLQSPNYASFFEFSIAKMVTLDNSGQIRSINYFNVDCVYRPYIPYVKIAPNFDFLYGIDFNDERGLILSGDFSLTTLTDAWIDYELRNKNYQNIFNRSIQNMETNRQIAREQEQWDIINKSANAPLTIGGSAAAGGMSGGIPGAIVGAAIGTFKSGMNIAGAVKQIGWNERAYQEMRDFAIDNFNMQLDNIKALPDTITHTSNLSANYKYYPVLEFYTCTEEEKNILINKIKYSGMTIGRIGNIKDYLKTNEETFIKGQMIRLEALDEDAHLAQDIYDEVNKGLFFVPSITINHEGGSE